MIQQIFKESKLSSCLMTVLGSAILAFGLYHVHSMSGVTEGGVLKNITAWEPGKRYIYNLHITKTGISVTATVTDWKTVDASENIWM